MDMVMLYPPDERINVLAPIVRGRKGEFKKELAALRARGFTRARIDGQFVSLDEEIVLDRRKNHSIDVLVDRLIDQERRRAASLRLARARADAGRRRRRHQHAGGRRSAVLAPDGVSDVRHQHAGDDAAGVLVQLAARRLPGVPGPRRGLRLRSAARRARRVSVARRWRRPALGRRATPSRSREMLAGLSRTFGIDPDDTVCAAAEEAARHRALWRGRRQAAWRRRRPRRQRDPFGADFEGVLPNLRRRFEDGRLDRPGGARGVPRAAALRGCEGDRLAAGEPRRARQGPADGGLRRPCRCRRRCRCSSRSS